MQDRRWNSYCHTAKESENIMQQIGKNIQNAVYRVNFSLKLQSVSVKNVASVTSDTSDRWSKNVKSFDDIPGPKGLPYFGTLLPYRLGWLNMKNVPDVLRQWYKQYGGIVKEIRAGHTVVHIFDPDLIRFVYAGEDKWPRIEPLLETTQLYRKQFDMSPGLGNTNDEEWYRLRTAIQQLMMRPKEVLFFLPGADRVALDFVSHIKQHRNSRNEVPDFSTELGRWSLESSGVGSFDRCLGFLTESGRREAVELIDANTTVFELTAKLKFALPLYKYLPSPTWKRLVAAESTIFREFKRHFDTTFETLKKKITSGQLKEGEFRFLCYMLGRPELGEKDIVTLTLSRFIDGLSTTTQALLFALYCLATNSAAQEKAFEEINSLLSPSSTLTADTFNQLSYVRAIIKESFRLFPINIEIARVTKKNMIIGDYQIPEGTVIHLNNTTLFRDPEFFEEPDTFIPERWLRDESVQKVHPFILLPFGHGPRMCAGRRIAEQEMAILLTRILQNFHLEWHHPQLRQKYCTLNVPDSPVQITFLDR
ncbi:probable cytochrome P450 CYP44 isoform X2 [Pomacea canaliculata]|uniref:probable cytochrome P450 CYP44 isoform X2 n=1 Tax=Pomacea canaliculata TaxID=400727 RepID=UPI000D73A2EA|nr:probable cytochrome P450 CYP44 isoform X2 [Pomacea canaliculata]